MDAGTSRVWHRESVAPGFRSAALRSIVSLPSDGRLEDPRRAGYADASHVPLVRALPRKDEAVRIRPTSQQLTDAAAIVDAWIRYRALTGAVPGVSFGLSHDGEVILSSAWGYADLETQRPAAPDTCYRVASITKTVTATLVMQLVERGRVRLDEPVTSYLGLARAFARPLGSDGTSPLDPQQRPDQGWVRYLERRASAGP